MSGRFASAEDLGKKIAIIAVETLERAAEIMLSPGTAEQYFDAVGVPPTQGATEWAPAVTDLRAQLDAAKDPDHYAQIAKNAAVVFGGLQKAIHGSNSPLDPADTFYRVLVPVLLRVLAVPKSPEFPRSAAFPVYVAVAALSFIDQRLQDDYPQGLFEQRWLAVARDLSQKAGWVTGGSNNASERDWAPLISDGIVVAFIVVAEFFLKETFRPTERPERARRFGYYWYGFDHPEMPGFETSWTLAQKAFTVVLSPPQTPFTVDLFKTIQPQRQPTPPALLTVTIVPVPKTLDPGGDGQIYIQCEAFSNIDVDLGGGWKFTIAGGPSFGVLASPKGVTPIGDVGFQVELSREWPPDQPSTAGPTSGTTSALSFEATRFSLGARADSEDLAAWLTLEKGTLAVNGGHWLSDYVPKLRFNFDVTANFSVLTGIQFRGGAGGDLLIPVNERIPFFVGALSVEAIRIRTMLGSDQNGTGFSLAATANLSLELLGILTLHVAGLGASYSIGTAPQTDGNMAGAFAAGWNLVLPQGAGLEIKVWKIKGGGSLLYDSKKDELSGALELDIGSAFSLQGLGIYQSANTPPGGQPIPKNWLALVPLQTSYGLPAITLDGLGVLYGSNRGTSPDAFLAAIASGNLSALLFAKDVVANAPAYLAALDQLFPPKQGASVMGVLAHFSALAGRISLALGVLFEYQASSLVRVYVVGRITAVCMPTVAGQQLDPKKSPIYILADGVAIWDTATDTLNLRVLLRNSRVWGGELTGGASVFHGAPQGDAQAAGNYVSVGGFHPDYTPPPTLFVPPRLSLVISKGDHIKATWQLYAAVTPSSFQFGVSGTLEAHLYGFGIKGAVSLDILCGFNFKGTIKLALSVELLLGSESIAAVAFSGTLAFYSPTVLSGRVSLSLLFWSIDMSGSVTIQDADSTPPEQPDVAAALAAAIADTRNWEAAAPAGLSLTGRTRDGLWISPNQPLRLNQPTVPLNVAIERFGSAVLPAPETFRIDSVQSGGVALTTQPVTGEFAPAMFLSLSNEEMLAAHGFETLEAGVEISRAMQGGDPAPGSDAYEEIVLDPKSKPETTGAPLSPQVLRIMTVFSGTTPASNPIVMRRTRFTVLDGSLHPQVSSKTLVEARAALQPGWRMVPEAEAV